MGEVRHDKLSTAALQNLVANRIFDKYAQWVEYDWVWSQVLLFTQIHRDNQNVEAGVEWISAACEHEKARRVGYDVDDLHFYSIEHLRELVAQVCAGIHSTRLDPAYADAERALYRLVDPSSRADIIGWHAGWHEDEEALTEALRALQDVLGGKKPKGLGR